MAAAKKIYLHTDYRQLLRTLLLERKAAFGKAFTFAKMAAACKVQRPYLSSVLAGRGDLNADQTFLACHFLQLSDDESRFVARLGDWSRSASPLRRAQLEQELKACRDAALDTGQHLDARPAPVTDSDALRAFYLDFTAQLIHMFLTVPRFRRDPSRIQTTLALDPSIWSAALGKIERAGLIKIRGKDITLLVENFHLPTDSELSATYRTQMRLRALARIEQRPRTDSFCFSVLCSANADARREIQARFLEFIAWAESCSQTGEQTQILQLNFDLLQWS